ncbi:MAG: hypothetical protein WD826_07875 [Actinomycetota bacterium]
MRTGLRTFALIVLAATSLAASGCRTSGLAFRTDERLEITSPEEGSTVTLPFDVVWSVEDFQVVGADGSQRNDAGYFAVLLDASPMPPGEDPAYYARDDGTCNPQTKCPDAAYLADRNVYLTEDTTFPIAALQDTRPVDRQGAPDRHEITIVLLNGRSERIGESAFKVEFTVDRATF